MQIFDVFSLLCCFSVLLTSCAFWHVELDVDFAASLSALVHCFLILASQLKPSLLPLPRMHPALPLWSVGFALISLTFFVSTTVQVFFGAVAFSLEWEWLLGSLFSPPSFLSLTREDESEAFLAGVQIPPLQPSKLKGTSEFVSPFLPVLLPFVTPASCLSGELGAFEENAAEFVTMLEGFLIAADFAVAAALLDCREPSSTFPLPRKLRMSMFGPAKRHTHTHKERRFKWGSWLVGESTGLYNQRPRFDYWLLNKLMADGLSGFALTGI